MEKINKVIYLRDDGCCEKSSTSYKVLKTQIYSIRGTELYDKNKINAEVYWCFIRKWHTVLILINVPALINTPCLFDENKVIYTVLFNLGNYFFTRKIPCFRDYYN